MKYTTTTVVLQHHTKYKDDICQSVTIRTPYGAVCLNITDCIFINSEWNISCCASSANIWQRNSLNKQTYKKRVVRGVNRDGGMICMHPPPLLHWISEFYGFQGFFRPQRVLSPLWVVNARVSSLNKCSLLRLHPYNTAQTEVVFIPTQIF